MYAHVGTYRRADADTFARTEIDWADGTGEVVSDTTAQTIARWWHSPAQRAIVALSHGLPFDTEELREEVQREITDSRDCDALLTWLDHLEGFLAGAEVE